MNASDQDLLQRVVVGELAASDPAVQRRMLASPEFREELEEFSALQALLDADAAQVGAFQAPPAMRTAHWGKWVGLAASLLIVLTVAFQMNKSGDEPRFPGQGQMMGSESLSITLIQPWDGTTLDFQVEPFVDGLSSLIEFIPEDLNAERVEFKFEGTRWTPTQEQKAQVPADAEWRLSVFDKSGTWLGGYPLSR